MHQQLVCKERNPHTHLASSSPPSTPSPPPLPHAQTSIYQWWKGGGRESRKPAPLSLIRSAALYLTAPLKKHSMRRGASSIPVASHPSEDITYSKSQMPKNQKQSNAGRIATNKVEPPNGRAKYSELPRKRTGLTDNYFYSCSQQEIPWPILI